MKTDRLVKVQTTTAPSEGQVAHRGQRCKDDLPGEVLKGNTCISSLRAVLWNSVWSLRNRYRAHLPQGNTNKNVNWVLNMMDTNCASQ
eukprot:5007306-Amphidinium_carterae.1